MVDEGNAASDRGKDSGSVYTRIYVGKQHTVACSYARFNFKKLTRRKKVSRKKSKN